MTRLDSRAVCLTTDGSQARNQSKQFDGISCKPATVGQAGLSQRNLQTRPAVLLEIDNVPVSSMLTQGAFRKRQNDPLAELADTVLHHAENRNSSARLQKEVIAASAPTELLSARTTASTMTGWLTKSELAFGFHGRLQL
jgi:hypothetical protein